MAQWARQWFLVALQVLVASGATVAGYGLSVGAAFSISAGIGSIGSTANYLLVNGLHQDKILQLLELLVHLLAVDFKGQQLLVLVLSVAKMVYLTSWEISKQWINFILI